MRKLVLAILFVTLVFPALSAAKNPCTGVTYATLQKHVPKLPQGKVLSKKPVFNLCELLVELNGKPYPFYVGKGYVIIGNLFSLGQSITNESYQKAQAKEAELQKGKFKTLRRRADALTVMVYKPSPSARRVLYMFTDPVCPYCARAEKQIKSIAKKYNVILKVLFYPVHRPRGTDLAAVAICKGLNLDTYLAKEWEKKANPAKEKCVKGEAILSKTDKLARELGITGVPTFIMDTGERVVGADIRALEEMLRKSVGK